MEEHSRDQKEAHRVILSQFRKMNISKKCMDGLHFECKKCKCICHKKNED